MKKGLIISASFICMVLIGLSVWLGGRERWEVTGLSSDFSEHSTAITHLENQLKEEPESVLLNYNLAYFYYKSGRFDETRGLLKKIIDSGERSNRLSKRVYYNMGNALFRLAEKEVDLESAIDLLGESLRFFKTVIELEKQESAYSSGKSDVDEDTAINYTIVQRRIKILADKLKQQHENSEQQKTIYQLVKELHKDEQALHERLTFLQKSRADSANLEERNQLLKLRSENRKRLKVIQEKIEKEFETSANPPAVGSRRHSNSI